MVMKGSSIEVGGDQHLVFIAPHPLCQLHAESMAKLRGDLTGLKALVGVVGHVTARLTEPLFGRLHFLESGAPVAVHAGDEHGPFLAFNGLFLVSGVVENAPQIRIDGLIRVLGVVHHTGQTVLDRPDFSCRHRLHPHWCRPSGSAPPVRPVEPLSAP